MSVKVHLRNLRTAPRKIRLVADLIRGLKVDEAMEQLRYIPKRSAVPVMKLLESAVAAAENDHKMSRVDLYISKIVVDDGATLKRSMPHAMGRAFPILKRTSSITIELDKKTVQLEELEEKKAEGPSENPAEEVKENLPKKQKNKGKNN